MTPARLQAFASVFPTLRFDEDGYGAETLWDVSTYSQPLPFGLNDEQERALVAILQAIRDEDREIPPPCLHIPAEHVEIGAWVWRMDLDEDNPDHGTFTQVAHGNEWGDEELVRVELVLVGGEILTRFPGDLVAVAMSDEAAQAWNQPSDPADAF